MLVTLYAVRQQLIEQVAQKDGAGEVNLVLFDVQQDQRRELAALLKSMDIALQEEVPVVTMRLAAVKNRPVGELRADAAARIPGWALRREYRSTYRAALAPSEKLAGGTWHAQVNGGPAPIPISLETGIAEALRVGVGDALEFDVQGVTLQTRVASLREVDWQRVRPNFFVVFPEGVLEAAPQFFVMAARADEPEATAAFQRAVVQRYGNVSVIDLTLILNTLNAILGRVSHAVRVVAAFTILSGFAVLAAAILSSRSQRIKESILLKTLGAPRSQILTGLVAEYVFAGALAALAGTALALAATWGLSLYFFDGIAHVLDGRLATIPLLATVITVAAGMLGCWGLFRRSSLDALRAES
jgi:putative ABC transport system permease protein